jgi:hypothetical protein
MDFISFSLVFLVNRVNRMAYRSEPVKGGRLEGNASGRDCIPVIVAHRRPVYNSIKREVVEGSYDERYWIRISRNIDEEWKKNYCSKGTTLR